MLIIQHFGTLAAAGIKQRRTMQCSARQSRNYNHFAALIINATADTHTRTHTHTCVFAAMQCIGSAREASESTCSAIVQLPTIACAQTH